MKLTGLQPRGALLDLPERAARDEAVPRSVFTFPLLHVAARAAAQEGLDPRHGSALPPRTHGTGAGAWRTWSSPPQRAVDGVLA